MYILHADEKQKKESWQIKYWSITTKANLPRMTMVIKLKQAPTYDKSHSIKPN